VRQIREQPSFAQSVEKLGGARRIDLALTTLMSALSFRPEGFPLVGDFGLRIAKTDPISVGDDVIPALRLYFQISDTGIVILWWLEEVPLDEEFTF
jgi:hypothetical protein